tara:strand:- start:2115 stop:2324 length:210 start_codon:yes stop_codon:yes gene_type:complete
MKAYTTLSEVNDLTRRGYAFNFNIKNDFVESMSNHLKIKPDEFEIDEVHRFLNLISKSISTVTERNLNN